MHAKPIVVRFNMTRTTLTVIAILILCVYAANAAVPRPYMPVKASDKEIRCIGRVTKLGDMLLPVQIFTADKKVLAQPMAIIAEPNALDGLKGAGRVIENNGDVARLEWTGESKAFHIKSSMSASCDGFCWYEISLTPKQSTKLTSIRLEIPRIADTARYVHTSRYTWGTLSQGLKEYGGKWNEKFIPYVWLGDEDRGLAWCGESSEGWQLTEPTNALKIDTDGSVVTFKTTLLDHEASLASPIVFKFGLQATPVRPVDLRIKSTARIMHDVHWSDCDPGKDGRIPLDVMRDGGVKTVVYHDGWTDYFGRTVTPYDKELRRLISECHKRGMKLLVYMGYGLARSAPEMAGHHDEWSTNPIIPWEPSFRHDFRAFDATCPKSGWSDWLIAGIDKLFTDYDLDGLYFDGTSEAWPCNNASHGCGYVDSTGVKQTTYPVLSARRLMRGIADAMHKHRPDAILDVHCSGNITIPTLSFCDSYWDGEQFENYTSKDKFEVPLDVFRTEFMGYSLGLNAEFLCYKDRPFNSSEAITLAWLHGVEVRPHTSYPDLLQLISPIWRAMDSFGATKAQWQPYWKDSGANCSDESVKASAWTRRGKALIWVSHLKREPVEANLKLNRIKLGLGHGLLKASDALSGKAIEVRDDSVNLKFDGMSYQLIEVQ